MKKNFNIARFGRLLVKHTSEHYKNYLMALTVLLGVMLIGGSFLIYIMEAPIEMGLQSAMFVSIMLLAGTIFTSNIFADYGDKKKSFAALCLPASHFEKYLLAWLYSFLGFLICYIAAFYLVDWFVVHAKHFPRQQAEMLNVFIMPFSQCFLLFAFLHSIAFWGAIFYNKLHFIKTAFLFFIVILILVFLNKFLLGMLLHVNVLASAPFSDVRLLEHGGEINIFLSADQQGHFIEITFLALSLIIWAAAYYRLKEKQV